MAAASSKADDVEAPVTYSSIPEEEAWWYSRLLFSWMQPLFDRATQLEKDGSALQQEDLLPLPTMDLGTEVSKVFEKAWAKQSGGNAPPTTKLEDLNSRVQEKKDVSKLPRALFSVVGSKFIIAGLIKAVNTALQFSFPLLLNAILKFIEESQAGLFDESDPWHVRYRGYWLSGLLLLAMGSKAVTESAYFHRVNRSGYQAKVAVSVAVYNKSLRLTNAERQSTTLGELINLMQVDASKIEAFVPQVHVLWDGMFQIIGYMTILYTLIGWPCFAGMLIMILAGPVQGIVMGRLFGMNRAMVKYTDKRIEVTNEALQGIQGVKMYTWEERFAANIENSRSEELNFLKGTAYLRGFSRAYMGALPGVVAVTSFIVYALAKSDAGISASTLFAALVAFDQLRFPLLFYPVALAQLVQAKVSAARVELFLGLKEVGDARKGESTFSRDASAKGQIIVKDAEVYWSDPHVPIATTDLDSSEHDTASTTSASLGKDKNETKEKSETDQTDAESSSELVYPKAALKNINLSVDTSELAVVIGRVGSGKSTLCSAVLNEAYLETGSVTLNGNVAYASQTPWILNATLRENILFGLPMNEERYSRVIKACQLEHDIKMLEDGDLTDIGERGINLSGGQKARISVARAAYSNADVIILDDPLSALDPEVAKELFFDCIIDLMGGKTRLLVTNQLQFLSSCDSVIALKRGEIIEQGTYDDLIADKKSEVNRLLSTGMGRRSSQAFRSSKGGFEEKKEQNQKKQESGPSTRKEKKELLTKEERNVGAVTLSVYMQYLKAGGGYLKFGLVYLGFVLSVANTLAITSWISFWTADSDYVNHSQAFYLGIYFMFTVTLGVFTFARAYLLASFGVAASYRLHQNLLNSILRAPQSFFDTTPLGRILSRFSKDLYSIDLELSDFLDFFLYCSLLVLVSLGTIIFVTPWLGIAVPPLGFIYFRVLTYFRRVSRETKRLDSISRSPVYAHFSETLGGLATIRAYGQNLRFMVDFEEKVDANTRGSYNNKSADRWLAIRLELIGSIIAGLAAIFACQTAISTSVPGEMSDSSFASVAGLSLTFAISMTSLLNWSVRSFANLEAAMNASERVLHYTENIPQEAPRTSSALQEHASNHKDSDEPSDVAVHAAGGKVEEVSEKWPETGEITLKNLRMRYRADTPLVLKGLSVDIKHGERIGVVGRTGSGKSSLLLTLLRLVEPSLQDRGEDYEAPILLDGVDVLRIGLKDLRSKIGIIPQNPVLFSGTIRSNVDPFNEYTDEQIWDALEKCGLKDSVDGMPGQLEATVAEYGENLSSGMRQMLVLGRALLRQCKVLLLDEATSSVDFETDKEIQRTLREAFSDCTILTIAHRINTIMDSDKILVMKDGLAAEFAPPKDLLEDEASLFSEIVRHAEAEEQT